MAEPSPAAPLPRPPRRILVIKLADLGDALLTTPLVRALRDAWPDARLDVLTTPQAAVAYRHAAAVDGIETIDVHGRHDRPTAGARIARWTAAVRQLVALRRRGYDVVVLCHPLVTRRGALKHAGVCLAVGAPVRAGLAAAGQRRAWFLTHRAADPGYDGAHVIEAMGAIGAAIGAPATAPRLAFAPGADAEAEADRRLAGLDGPARAPGRGGPLAGRRIALHPGAGPYSAARRWPPASFADLARRLRAAGAALVLVGTAGDDGAAVRAAGGPIDLDLTGATDVPTLAAVLARCDLVVANDGGVAHLAAAVGTPVTAIFGPSNDRAWGPWPPARPAAPSPHRVVALDLPCRPCLYVGHRLGQPAGCRTRDCLRWLPVERVWSAVLGQLGPARQDGRG